MHPEPVQLPKSPPSTNRISFCIERECMTAMPSRSVRFESDAEKLGFNHVLPTYPTAMKYIWENYDDLEGGPRPISSGQIYIYIFWYLMNWCGSNVFKLDPNWSTELILIISFINHCGWAWWFWAIWEAMWHVSEICWKNYRRWYIWRSQNKDR